MTSAPAWENVSALGGTRTPNLLIRSYRHDPVRSKRSRPIRVWLAAQDGHRTCGLLYPAAVPGFRFQENARVFHGAAH
jgi:hypothetical protein